MTGIQGGSATSDDDARRLYYADIDYFRTHPETAQFVRPVEPADLAGIRQFAEQEHAWHGVRWVLVRVMNERRDLRIRVPLHEGQPHLTDGDLQFGWHRDRGGTHD